MLDLVEHIGGLVSVGVVRDKRDREPSAGKAIVVDADAGLPDSIDMRELEGANRLTQFERMETAARETGGGYCSSANS